MYCPITIKKVTVHLNRLDFFHPEKNVKIQGQITEYKAHVCVTFVNPPREKTRVVNDVDIILT